MHASPIELTITQTWDGQVLPKTSQFLWTLQLDSDHLLIRVSGPFFGDPSPPSTVPGPTPALWEHEVAELFIAGPDQEYLEIELGPHGHHLMIALDGVRTPVQDLLPMVYEAHIDGDRWTGLARVSRALIPKGPHRIGAFAIHGSGVQRRYLSMTRLPGETPDFHQLEHLQPIALPE